jgi:Xaa-Pro aminopeptidase
MRSQLKRFIEQMEPNSIAIIPAAHESTEATTPSTIPPGFRLLVLTGFPEPDAVAVIDPASKTPFTLYVRPRDLEMETWFGRRQGTEGAVKNYGADKAFPIDKFDADLAKLLDGYEKLYYGLLWTRLSIRRSSRTSQRSASALEVRVSAAHHRRSDDHPRRDASAQE